MPDHSRQIPAYIAYHRRFEMVDAPDWWARDDWKAKYRLTLDTMQETGVRAVTCPEGAVVILTGICGNLLEAWCRTEADLAAFMCGPGAAFASACAQIASIPAVAEDA